MTQRARHRGPGWRGFTVVEALLVVAVLAIAIPASTAFLQQRADDRAQAVQALRATMLAQLVMEHVLADVASSAPDLGFAALSAPASYLDTPVTGLRARLEAVTSVYADAGLEFEVDVSGLVSRTGAATGQPTQDLFRIVAVTVRGPSVYGGEVLIDVEAMVSD